MKVTLRDVARQAGVSNATASKALNSRGDVAEDTRDRVLRAARTLGYGTRIASNSILERPVINVLIDAMDPYYGVEVLRGLIAEGQKQGVDVIPHIETAETSVSSMDEWERLHLTSRTIGIVIVVLRSGSPIHEVARRRALPVIVIDPYSMEKQGDITISSTNWQGGRDATTMLIELGHRRIGVIAGPSHFVPGVERLYGYRTALDDHAISWDQSLVVEGSYTFGSGFDAAEKLLDLASPPTAIFALSDRMALGAIRALETRGKKVPRDISIVGFDNSPGSELVTPALTTVGQPLASMGRVAVSTIQSLREGTRLHTHTFQLATTLIERASCAPPRYAEAM